MDTSTLDVTSPSQAFRANVGNISINDSDITAVSGDTAIYAVKGNISVGGASVLDLDASARGLNGQTGVTIENSSVTATSSGSDAIYSPAGAISVTGGSVLDLTSYYCGLISRGGDITVDDSGITAASSNDCVIFTNAGDISISGADTRADLTSSVSSAILTNDHSIYLNAWQIKMTATEGNAACLVRQTASDTSVVPENKIIIGEDIEGMNNIVATTEWISSDGQYYANSMIVPADTVMTENGLLPSDYTPTIQDITMDMTSADYSAVNKAIAATNELVKEYYVNYEIVENATAAVEWERITCSRIS